VVDREEPSPQNRAKLSEIDIDVYRHLASGPRSDPLSIVRSTGHPLDVVDASCRRLAAMGLVAVQDDATTQVMPDGPEIAFERLRARIDSDYAAQRRAATDLRSHLTQILGDGMLAGDTHRPYLEELTTAEAKHVRLLELAGHARQEVLRMWTGQADRSWMADKTENRIFARALERGLSVRIICPTSWTGRTEAPRGIATLGGALIRTVTNPPLELHLFDRSVAVIVATPAAPDAPAFVVHGQPLAYTIQCFFENSWSHGAAVAEPGNSYEIDHLAPADEKALMQLLADGMKDETVARTLGCSVRTVRRRVSEILEKLDSTSRFQAGVEAARRGWV
jgi:DNA-binding CsgD family transcriptional regulator